MSTQQALLGQGAGLNLILLQYSLGETDNYDVTLAHNWDSPTILPKFILDCVTYRVSYHHIFCYLH